ncbi:MAG: hypothetical protein SFX19_01590 [Alphaproteobacteria bacterium]|nr:hypothetical protein [Alphaproteobacteria bacterium]
MKPWKILAVCTILTLATSRASYADEVTQGEAYCYEMQHAINALADFTETTCLPSKDKNGITFLMLSSKPVFSVAASKKAWLLVVAGSLGKTLNEHPKFKADSVIVSDFNSMRSRQGFRFPAKLAKTLQPKVYDGSMELETMYSKILAELTPFSVPERPH